jgi:hypothetical protein
LSSNGVISERILWRAVFGAMIGKEIED